MKRWIVGCAVTSLLAVPAAKAQDQVAVFKPTAGWVADYGDEYCRLVRTFSDGKDELSLALERLQPGAQVRMIIVGEGLKPFRNADQIAYQFGPTGASGEARYVRSQTSDGKQFVSFDPVFLAPLGGLGSVVVGRGTTPVVSASIEAAIPGTPLGAPPMYNRDAEQETARGITAIVLSKGLTSPVRIETGSLRAPIAAMQACADDLLQVWGLDPEKHKTLTAVPLMNPNPDGVLPQGTIPFGEFSKFGGGANQVRLLIGADGKVTSCAIYSPTLSQSLNERICKLAKERASFQPAKDADGQPLASVWMGSPMFLGPPFGGRR